MTLKRPLKTSLARRSSSERFLSNWLANQMPRLPRLKMVKPLSESDLLVEAVVVVAEDEVAAPLVAEPNLPMLLRPLMLLLLKPRSSL